MIKYFLLGISAIIIISCQNNKLEISCNGATEERTVRDSTDNDGNKLTIYDNDSIYYFKSDTLFRIEYLNSNNRIKYKEYNNGKLYFSQYRPELTSGLSLEFYYVTGNIYRQQYEKDTIIITAGNPLNAFELIIEYYENGNIRHKGYMANIEGQTTAIGIWCYFTEDEQLLKTDEYVYSQKSKINYYRIERFYSSDGKLQSEKTHQESLGFD